MSATATRSTRSDALPEATEYRDSGCEVAPSCLACPLPVCRYDVPGGARAIRIRERDRAIRAEYARGASVDEIAERHGLSHRRVYRITEGARA